MTLHIADIASYQLGLTLADLQRVGFSAINVKISHGVGQRSVHPNVHTLVHQARLAGMTVGTFHWLMPTPGGAEQAAYAYARMQELPGGTAGLRHAVDVEEATLVREAGRGVYLAYCRTMAQLLGREIITYTGDWWWQARGWAPAPESPWLWSAPRVGYLDAYPGDMSAHWAGYGGWPMVNVMQYCVAPIAGIQVSQSAVAEDDWERMGYGMAWVNIPASNSLVAEFNAAFPGRSKASDGTIGDGEHSQSSSDHNPDETGRTPGEDPDSINEVHARDVTSTLNRAGWNMQRVVDIIVARCRSGQEKRLQNIIYNRRIISRSWGWDSWHAYSGANPHDKHAHFGFRYGSGSGTSNTENITAEWGFLAAVQGAAQPQNQEQDMDANEMTSWATGAGKRALGQAVTEAPVGNSGETVGQSIQRGRAVDALIPQILTLVQNASDVDVQELAEAMGPIIVAGLVPQIGELDGISPEEVQQRVEAGVRAVLGQLDNSAPAGGASA